MAVVKFHTFSVAAGAVAAAGCTGVAACGGCPSAQPHEQAGADPLAGLRAHLEQMEKLEKQQASVGANGDLDFGSCEGGMCAMPPLGETAASAPAATEDSDSDDFEDAGACAPGADQCVGGMCAMPPLSQTKNCTAPAASGSGSAQNQNPGMCGMDELDLASCPGGVCPMPDALGAAPKQDDEMDGGLDGLDGLEGLEGLDLEALKKMLGGMPGMEGLDLPGMGMEGLDLGKQDDNDSLDELDDNDSGSLDDDKAVGAADDAEETEHADHAEEELDADSLAAEHAAKTKSLLTYLSQQTEKSAEAADANEKDCCSSTQSSMQAVNKEVLGEVTAALQDKDAAIEDLSRQHREIVELAESTIKEYQQREEASTKTHREELQKAQRASGANSGRESALEKELEDRESENFYLSMLLFFCTVLLGFTLTVGCMGRATAAPAVAAASESENASAPGSEVTSASEATSVGTETEMVSSAGKGKRATGKRGSIAAAAVARVSAVAA